MQEKSREIAYLTEDVFFELVDELKAQQKVSLEVLCEGVCAISVLSELTWRHKMPGKMLRDRILERLGVSEDRCENLLDDEDYKEWLRRQQITKAVMHRELDLAKKLLEEYRNSEAFQGKLEQQFYYAMQVQVMKYEEAAPEEIQKVLDTAVKLTVPHVDEKKILDMKLSLQELNLVLEYMRYTYPEHFKECCQEILSYLDGCAMEESAVAKLYPKVALELCRVLHEEREVQYGSIIRITKGAIDYLRRTRKNYYLWQLLNMRQTVLEELLQTIAKNDGGKQTAGIEHMRQETLTWKNAIEAAYNEGKYSCRTEHFCHLYLQNEHYCIDEIMWNRRKALRISREKLNQDTFDKKTVVRLEKEHRKAHRYTVRILFARLKLSGELHRADVVLSTKRERELLEALIKYSNNFEVEKQRETLQLLEECLDKNVPLNRQFIKGQQAILLYSEDKNNAPQAFELMKEALEYTIPLKTVLKKENLYLTGCEINCLYNMMGYVKKKEKESYQNVLLKLCRKYEEAGMVEEHVSRYSWIMTAIARDYSNARRYEEAIVVSERNIQICLECGRLDLVAQNLNCISWNRTKLQNESALEEARRKRRKILEVCSSLCGFCRDDYWKDYYMKKWKEVGNA